jgi:uncharacterized protein (DUF1330 family)
MTFSWRRIAIVRLKLIIGSLMMTKKILIALLSLSLVLAHSFSFAGNGNKDKITDLQLYKNERLTMVIVKNKKDGEHAQKKYLDGITKLAGKNSIREVAIFPIIKTLAGTTKPQAIAFYAWKDAAASHKVRHSMYYKNNLKPLQKFGWDHLSAADVDLPDDEFYQFNPSKTYTLAEVWLKDAEIYNRYYTGTKVLREKMGAKIIFKHSPNEYNSLIEGQQAPNFTILIEWPTPHGPELYTQSPIFKKYLPFIEASIDHLNWYEIGFWPVGKPEY